MEKLENQEKIDNKYLILEKIGVGGKTDIFLVKDKQTDIEYVAKVFKGEDGDSFEKEIQILKILSQFDNPYIIKIIDSGEGLVIRKYKEQKKKKIPYLRICKEWINFRLSLLQKNWIRGII